MGGSYKGGSSSAFEEGFAALNESSVSGPTLSVEMNLRRFGNNEISFYATFTAIDITQL